MDLQRLGHYYSARILLQGKLLTGVASEARVRKDCPSRGNQQEVVPKEIANLCVCKNGVRRGMERDDEYTDQSVLLKSNHLITSKN